MSHSLNNGVAYLLFVPLRGLPAPPHEHCAVSVLLEPRPEALAEAVVDLPRPRVVAAVPAQLLQDAVA